MASLLIPDLGWRGLRKAGSLALAAALIAGGFGILRDQLTYTISPEYFTRMKFAQFHSADFGFPNRVFVAEIGFLATWWVGLIGGWFLARVAIPKFAKPGKSVLCAIGTIMLAAIFCGLMGHFLGPIYFAHRPQWGEALDSLGVKNARAFHQVAGTHLGSYAGAMLGWVTMMIVFWKTRPHGDSQSGLAF